MSTRGEIQIGDIGTLYQVPIYDDDLAPANFDPSSATTKKLYFKMPTATGFATLERTATAAQVTIDGASIWCLTYTVVTGDAAEFHIAAGAITIQGSLTYADGRTWRSNKITTDQQGRPLKVYSNI